MDKRQKWVKALCAVTCGGAATCPNCGGHQFKDGYIELNKKEHTGWGALWCEDCRNAFVVSRVILDQEEIRAKIVPSLPADLKFV